MDSRSRPQDQDVEAAVTGESGPIAGSMLEPTDLMRRKTLHSQRKDKTSDMRRIEEHRTAVDPGHLPVAALSIRSDSSPRLLSDEENDRMNKKIDKLIAAIDDRRPIHFAPDATTGEVEIFADYEVSNQDEEDELEHDIAASPENFGRIIRFGNGVRRMRSPDSLRYASSTDSWASTDSKKSSSNAWERAVAAANVRFALAHGQGDRLTTAVRQPYRSSRRGRSPVRKYSPIPLDFHKPLRTSTPSIHSNGSEQDTSSPLFGKSCERILRETYAKSPESLFQRESPEDSQLDEWAFISKPRDVPSPKLPQAKAPGRMSRAIGVFQDGSNGESPSKEGEKLALRSKVLKDVSNLRRPGYLQSNSFAKDAKSGTDCAGTAAPATPSSLGFGGASNLESRRAYINKMWPGLLNDRSNGGIIELPKLDGAARRRNEQAIGHPIDKSQYSLSQVRPSEAASSLNIDLTRQTHFDLALARLEGRALPPAPSPIKRHPDWAALHDRDIQADEGHRPLPLRGPTPSRPANPSLRRSFWRDYR